MKIKDLLLKTSQKLNIHNIQSPQLIAESVLSYVLNKPKEWIIINREFELNDKIISEYNNLIERVLKGEPLAYITGQKEFFSLKIKVNKNVLIPRPETEILVESAIELIKKYNLKKILEIGTGSGAIPLAIESKIPDIKIVATDVSLNALKLAKENFKNFNIICVGCDLFKGLKGKFDLIISNPPYIKTKDLYKLPKSVKYEPEIALNGGEDGMIFYEKIIIEGKNYLNKGGFIIFENGYISAIKKIKKLFAENDFYDIKIKKDFSNFPRVIIARC